MSNTHPGGYLSTPVSGSGPPILVLHAWWGLNATIKGICDRLTANGFFVFAPDLYHGKVANTIIEAEMLSSNLDEDYLRAEIEITDAVKYPCEKNGTQDCVISVVSFSSL